MLVIPTSHSDNEYILVILLDGNNIDRIRQYDPASVIVSDVSGPFAGKKLKEIIITFANADDVAHIVGLANSGKMKEALAYAARGWQWRPDKGDYDGPPLSLKTDPGETKQ